jgi:hypothetical protein
MSEQEMQLTFQEAPAQGVDCVNQSVRGRGDARLANLVLQFLHSSTDVRRPADFEQFVTRGMDQIDRVRAPFVVVTRYGDQVHPFDFAHKNTRLSRRDARNRGMVEYYCLQPLIPVVGYACGRVASAPTGFLCFKNYSTFGLINQGFSAFQCRKTPTT